MAEPINPAAVPVLRPGTVEASDGRLKGTVAQTVDFAFSPDNKWMIAKQENAHYYAWPLAGPPIVAPTPALKISGDEYKISGSGTLFDDPSFSFSSDGNYLVSTRPRGEGLYVWPTKDGIVGEPRLVPLFSQGENERNYRFLDYYLSPDASRIAVESGGVVHVWPADSAPDLNNPVIRLYSGNVSVTWCTDSTHFFLFAGADIYLGDVNGTISKLPENSTKVSGLTTSTQADYLFRVGAHDVSFVRRSLYLWGIPVYRYSWPKTAEYKPRD